MKEYKMPEIEIVTFVSAEEITDPETGSNNASMGTTISPFHLFAD